MSHTDHVAEATVQIHSSPEDVWDALTTPERIESYMFGTQVETTWDVGSPITWKGEWRGAQYEDKGKILSYEPEQLLSYSHFSPLSGEPDAPENYHTVTIKLTPNDGTTKVTLTQDNNDTEEAKNHSQENWSTMLQALKEHLENGD
jgi:uncharacterized protein YndB with AHSA1/START domain